MDISFSNRVKDYVKYRPTYPSDAIDYLYDIVKLNENSTVVDIGAGTRKVINYGPMMKELGKLFKRYEENGKVAFIYETELYWGEI